MLDPDKLLEDTIKEEAKSIKAAPLVRTMAKKDGVDLSLIKGTGRNGCITKSDYESYTGEPIPHKPVSKETAPMNHLKEDIQEIGGATYRRVRGTLDHSGRKVLDIPENVKNNRLHYRWFDDIGGRIQSVMEAGYQPVDQSSLSKDESITVRRRVGTNRDGTELHSVLMATPKEWFEDRQKKAEDRRRDQENGLFSNKPVDENGEVLGEDFYQPDIGSKIS